MYAEWTNTGGRMQYLRVTYGGGPSYIILYVIEGIPSNII